MKIVKLFFGLPRLDHKLLYGSCNQIEIDRNDYIENMFYLWEAQHDDREKVIANKNINIFMKQIQKIENNNFIDKSIDLRNYVNEINKYLLNLKKEINYPNENNERSENFKIKIKNIISQCVARTAISREIMKTDLINQDVIYILTRPDVILSDNINIKKIDKIIADNNLILCPRSGWHAGGVCDHYMIFKKEFLYILIGLTDYIVQRLNEGDILNFEKIFRNYIELNNFNIKSFDRIAYIMRNGRLKHSGADGLVYPDLFVS